MEVSAKEFLEITDFTNVLNCSGYGSSDGCGDGSGDSCGFGSLAGTGFGPYDAQGFPLAFGVNHDWGYGDGTGDGSGWGCGDGDGSGCASVGIKAINSQDVFLIDGVPTILTSLRRNIAMGFILQSDLTLTPCFVVKSCGRFAHGDTLHAAVNALREKLYDDSTEEERLAAFKKHFPVFDKKYPAREFFTWHHILTGSCKAGREAFCRDRGIDLDKDKYTVYEFILKTMYSYGGHIIQRLIE